MNSYDVFRSHRVLIYPRGFDDQITVIEHSTPAQRRRMDKQWRKAICRGEKKWRRKMRRAARWGKVKILLKKDGLELLMLAIMAAGASYMWALSSVYGK